MGTAARGPSANRTRLRRVAAVGLPRRPVQTSVLSGHPGGIASTRWKRATGIEPAWSCLEGSGLTSWLHPHSRCRGKATSAPTLSCDSSVPRPMRLARRRAPHRHRTGSLLLTMQVLFSLSFGGTWTWRAPPPPPPACKAGALLNELQAQIVAPGIEPGPLPCRGSALPVSCATKLARRDSNSQSPRYQRGA